MYSSGVGTDGRCLESSRCLVQFDILRTGASDDGWGVECFCVIWMADGLCYLCVLLCQRKFMVTGDGRRKSRIVRVMDDFYLYLNACASMLMIRSPWDHLHRYLC